MADQTPEELHLKHVRAPDYKEISADGTLHKIVNNHLVITFYIEDSRVTGEVLKRDGQDTYRIAAIEEEKQRFEKAGCESVTELFSSARVAYMDARHLFGCFVERDLQPPRWEVHGR